MYIYTHTHTDMETEQYNIGEIMELIICFGGILGH